jgi:hypothetical protein
VGGGDSVTEAAMGLAHQRGNRMILSYSREGVFAGGIPPNEFL